MLAISYYFHISEEGVIVHLGDRKEDSQTYLRPEDLRVHVPQDKSVRIHFLESSDKRKTTRAPTTVSPSPPKLLTQKHESPDDDAISADSFPNTGREDTKSDIELSVVLWVGANGRA